MNEEENNQQAADTGAENTQVQDQVDNWDSAEADFLADKGVKTDEQTKSEKTPEEQAAEAANSEGKKSDEEQGAGDDSEKGAGAEEKTDPNADENLEQSADDGAPYREARQIQRELEADREQFRTDIKKEMFPEWSDDILDDQGEPLKTPRDVMGHINPLTITAENPKGRRFTEEEATAWLFAAQKHKDNERAQMTDRIEHIADVMIQQRDEADVIKGKFGKLLADMPDLRKEIWADYKRTLVIDENSGLIVDAPVSLQRFFERALEPYAQYAAQLQTQAAAKKKTQDDTARKQTQQDREDIHSAGGGSVTDPEEDGWAKAAKEFYEG